MSRRESVPAYRRHRPSGQAVVTLADLAGNRKDYYLGPYGTRQSKAEYARLIAEWTASGKRIPHQGPAPADLTVNELILAFWHHAKLHYRHPDGTPTSELDEYRLSFRPLKELYGHTLARDFGPLSLKGVRQSMLDSGLCRRVINARVGRVRRAFKWAVAEELVPASVFHALAAVTGLSKGRTTAREPEPIRPVSDEDIEKTLPKLNRYVAGMVRFQRLTGCRPQDVCNIRRCDIDTTGDVWTYRPPVHKNAWRGKDRVIAIGPKAQAVLAEFATDRPEEHIFSPARMTAERMKDLRASRKTKVQPSQVNRAKRRPKHKPGERYSPESYCRAVVRGCEAAGVPSWCPLRLRHTRGTEVRKLHGLEAAQVTLGHSQARVTEIYAESDSRLAAQVALASG